MGELSGDSVVPTAFGVGQEMAALEATAALEACDLILEATELINQFGVSAKLIEGDQLGGPSSNGRVSKRSIITTTLSYELPIGSRTYFVRPVVPASNRPGLKNIFFALGETDDPEEIMVRDLDLIRLEVDGSDDDSLPGLYDPSGRDKPEDVSLALNIVRDIAKRETAAKKTRDREQAEAAATNSDAAIAQRAREAKSRSRRRAIRTGRNLTAALVALGSLSYALDVSSPQLENFFCNFDNECAVATYDSGHFQLDEGTVLAVGQSGHPEATQQVRLHQFQVASVPELTATGFIPADRGKIWVSEGSSPKNPSKLNNPRMVMMGNDPSSNAFKGCVTAYVTFGDSNKEIVTATNLPKNETNFIDVKLGRNTIRACWDVAAKKRAPVDNPEVIFQEVTPHLASEIRAK